MLLSEYQNKQDDKTSLPRLNYKRFNGRKLKHKTDYYPIILKLLQNKPKSPLELSYVLGKCTKTVQRYLADMKKEGTVEKIPSTHKYQIKGQGFTPRILALSILDKNDFYKCSTIDAWVRHARKTKHELDTIKSFMRLCMGKWTLEFKIHPDTWMHPETTEDCVDTLLKTSGTTQLSQGKRGVIRHFLKFGLKLNISTEEAKSLGIGGHKNSIGKYSTVSFQKGQYEKAKLWFEKNSDEKNLLLFGLKFWSFCRPSVIYTIRTNQLQFHKRRVKKSKFFKPFESKLSCHIPDLLEYKTNKEYPKYVFDGDLTEKLYHYTKKRKEKGFKYLFWDDNSTNFTFENYTKLILRKTQNDNELLKKMFHDIGCSGIIFETRANYAVRHVGFSIGYS